MLIGDRNTFAVEFSNQLTPNTREHVFGRMCVRAQGCRLGDMVGPLYMLDVPGSILRELIGRLDSLDDVSLADISDRDVFNLLKSARHGAGDSGLPLLDIESFDKFDFLTNAGESFDGTLSFIVGGGDYLRLLFTDEKKMFHATRVEQRAFVRTVAEFLRWMDEQVGTSE